MARALVWVALAGCGRFDFAVAGDGPADGATCSALTVPDTGIITGDFSMLVDNATGSCGGGSLPDQVYAIDVPDNAALIVAADGPSETADTLVYIRTVCDDPASEIACDSSGGAGPGGAWRTGPLPAARYWAFVDADATGTYEGTIQVLLPAGSPCSAANQRDRCAPELQCVAGTCMPDVCANAMPVGALPAQLTVMTTGATNLHASSLGCTEGQDGGARAPEVVLQIVLPAAVSNLHATTESAQTDYDTLIYLRDACLGTEIACNDDGGTNMSSVIDSGPLPAGTYYLFIDGFAYKSGTAMVSIN